MKVPGLTTGRMVMEPSRNPVGHPMKAPQTKVDGSKVRISGLLTPQGIPEIYKDWLFTNFLRRPSGGSLGFLLDLHLP